ncbi:hypothetical protein B0H17DRAFT_838264, partial [Mycena rosella]
KDTLRRRPTRNASMNTFNATKQKLTPSEERVVVDTVLACHDRGFPLTHAAITAHANDILKSQ